jgi:hypothetical protein
MGRWVLGMDATRPSSGVFFAGVFSPAASPSGLLAATTTFGLGFSMEAGALAETGGGAFFLTTTTLRR